MNESSPAAAVRASLARSRGSSDPWFERRGWRFGSTEFNAASLLVLLAAGLAPLASFVFGGMEAPQWPKAYPLLAMLWAMLVGLGYPAWAWLETRAFDAWLATVDAAARPAAQARFTARTSHARMFWLGVLAAYVAAAAFSELG
jgi:hypothetical protein